MSFFSDFKRSIKRVDVEEVTDLFVYRPAAFLFVKAIFRTSITPNQITCFSILVGIMAGVCFGLGHPETVVAGACLYGLSVVLDCADGQLARLKKNGTRLGRVLDGMVDYITGISVYLGIALGLKPEGWNAGRWWLLLVAASQSNIFHSIVIDYYRTRFLNIVNGVGMVEDEDYRSFKDEYDRLGAAGKRSVRRWAIGLYLTYLNLQKRLTVGWSADSVWRKVSPEVFRKANRFIMRGWTFLGSSTQITLLILAVLFERIDLYFWAQIVVLNLWAVVLYFVQGGIDRRLERSQAG